MIDRQDELDARYRGLYPVRAGFLPAGRHGVTPFNRGLQAAAMRRDDAELEPSVQALARLMARDGVVRMLVAEMIDDVDAAHRTVETPGELLRQLDHIIRLAPHWEDDPAKRHFFPMSTLFTYMMMTRAGEAAFRNRRFNDALRAILRAWCAYLDSPDSRDVLNEGPHGWLSPQAQRYNRLDTCRIPDKDAPHWGFASFNAFFHREIKPSERPISAPGDPRVVVSANDGTVYRVAREVASDAPFWIKAQPYSVRDMLAGSPLTERFAGGDVLQSYLSGADYHRWHAPVAGTVVELRVVEGLMFSNLESMGNDISGMGSQGYYTNVNTRGICIIKADHPGLGHVCVMPVGITEVSSIRHSVEAGDRVEKGQEIGRFSYGGSSMALLFERGAIERFTAFVPDDPGRTGRIRVNAEIAIAT